MAGEETVGEETVGERLLSTVCRVLWSTSYTVLSVDLKRAAISYDGPPLLTRRRGVVDRNNSSSNNAPQLVDALPRGAIVSATPYAVERQEGNGSSSGSSGSSGSRGEAWGRLRASQAEARLKVLQVWELHSGKATWCSINLGVGGVFQMDKGQLQPKVRLKANNASLHLLPEPQLELRAKWPLGGASSKLGIQVRCRLPLSIELDKMWQHPPRLLFNIFNTAGRSFHLSPAGLLLDDNVVELGKYTRLRISAAVEFPRELPAEEGDKPFKLDIRRVGIKARTL